MIDLRFFLNPNLCHIMHHVLCRHDPEDQGQLSACLWVPALTSTQNNACDDWSPNLWALMCGGVVPPSQPPKGGMTCSNSTSPGSCAEEYASVYVEESCSSILIQVAQVPDGGEMKGLLLFSGWTLNYLIPSCGIAEDTSW